MTTAPQPPETRPGGEGARDARAALGVALFIVAIGAVALVGGVGPPHGPIALVIACHGPLLLASWCAAGRISGAAGRDHGRALRLTWTLLLHVSVAVGVLLVIGLAHALSRTVELIALSSLGIGALVCFARRGSPPMTPSLNRDRSTWAWLPLFVAGAIVAPWTVLHAQYDFDELTYHLFFPARWAQEGGIFIVPTWFSDPAPAYAPSATEVFFLSLMLPMQSDHLARGGQLIFWVELLAVVAALARELGLRTRAAATVTLCVAATPAMAWQAGTAMVDVALAAHLTAIVLFALRMARQPNAVDGAGLLLATGLALGTKFLALPYLLALLPLWGIVVLAVLHHVRRAGARRTQGWGVAAGALLLAAWNGGYWYARNWILTGNPLYPLEMRAGGLTLFDGAFTRDAMINSSFNQSRRGWSGVTEVLGNALRTPPWFASNAPLSPTSASTLAAAAVIILTCVGTSVLLLRPHVRRRSALLSLNLSIMAMAALFWWSVPFQEARFTWPMLVLAIVSNVALLESIGSRFRGMAAVLFAIIWVGLMAGEWLNVFAVKSSLVAIIAAVAAFALWGRRPRFALPATTLLLACGVWISLWTVARQGDRPRAEAFALSRWNGFGDAWAWTDERVAQATIAYAGNNVPYFLTGPRQQNRVVHLPAGGEPGAVYHDFARNPTVRSLGKPNVSDFAPQRIHMDGRIWLRRLKDAGVDLVVVTRLFSLVCVSHRHDPDGFPIERQWLDTLAGTRRPDGEPLATRGVFGRGWLLIYRLNLPDTEADWPDLASISQDETDALDRRRKDRTPPGEPIRHYPHAAGVIEHHALRLLP